MFVSREEVAQQLESPRTTLPYFTKYEYTALLAARAQQLAEGAQPLISIKGISTADPRFVWKVAEREIMERKLPFILRRPMPNGGNEYWAVSELQLAW
jgi:DNA-directed RNA polymerase I, II, and III subunit RPABC2